MPHEEFVWELVRNIAGGTIVFLLCLLLKRRIARHDTEKQAEKDWRNRVDAYITRGERRKHPRDAAPRKTNGMDSDDEPDSGPHSGRTPRVRKP